MSGRYLALAVGLAAAAAAASPARAQCRLCAAPATGSEESKAALGLEVETRLDFDRLVLLSAGEGTATLLPDGSRSVSGVVSAISGRAMVGSVVLRGEPGRAVRVALPARIDLYSLSGGRIALENVVSDLPPLPKLDSAGMLTFRFGGKLRVTGDAEGDYRGDVPITVEYL